MPELQSLLTHTQTSAGALGPQTISERLQRRSEECSSRVSQHIYFTVLYYDTGNLHKC